MKLVTCGSCGFMGSQEELKSYSVSREVNKEITATSGICGDPDSAVTMVLDVVTSVEVKEAFEGMSAVESNLDLFYEGCPSCESQLIFYKEMLMLGEGMPIQVSHWDLNPSPDSVEVDSGSFHPNVVQQTTTVPDPPVPSPRTRPKESTVVKAVCDVCSTTFESSNHGARGLGGKCPKCTSQLIG